MWRRSLLAAILVCGLPAAACAPKAPGRVPGEGSLTVGVITSGRDATSLTFRVDIDSGSMVRTVKADAGVLTLQLPAGEHTVALEGLPAGCKVDGDARRTITIDERRVLPVKFVVKCG